MNYEKFASFNYTVSLSHNRFSSTELYCFEIFQNAGTTVNYKSARFIS